MRKLKSHASGLSTDGGARCRWHDRSRLWWRRRQLHRPPPPRLPPQRPTAAAPTLLPARQLRPRPPRHPLRPRLPRHPLLPRPKRPPPPRPPPNHSQFRLARSRKCRATRPLILGWSITSPIGVTNPWAVPGYTHQEGNAFMWEPLSYFGIFADKEIPWLADSMEYTKPDFTELDDQAQQGRQVERRHAGHLEGRGLHLRRAS